MKHTFECTGLLPGLAMLLLIPLAAAQTFTTLYSFTGGPDGGYPEGGLVQDSAGNLYGVTNQGGANGFGAVYKLDSTGKETVLHSFTGGADGGNPWWETLVLDAQGNLYGTAFNGGDLNCNPPYGCGTIFKISPANKLTMLHTFTGIDGLHPQSGLIRDTAGNFYGTASGLVTFGGIPYCPLSGPVGTLFKMTAGGQYTVLHTFTGPPDGSCPADSPTPDGMGDLYGSTEYGGYASQLGSLFKLNVASGVETVIRRFNSGIGGKFPYTALVRDGTGNFYGVSLEGGSNPTYGMVFKVDAAGHETILYNFAGPPDGALPELAVARDAQGNLYGTTVAGGTNNLGIVYKLDPSGKETVLHSFTGSDGASPHSVLLLDAAGNIYGTTTGWPSYGGGTVFKIAP